MKKAFLHLLRAFTLLVAIFIGSIPFLLSLISGIMIRRVWVAYLIGFGITVAITVYSSVYPETFRFGRTDLRIHDGVSILGSSSLLASCGKNLFFAYIGVLTGFAAREGYNQTKIESGPGE